MPSKVEERRWSTLVLCAYNAVTLVQPGSQSSADRARKVQELMSSDQTLSPSDKHRTSIRFATLGVDFDVLPTPYSPKFLKGARLVDGLEGGVLINPDQHILDIIDIRTPPEHIFAAVKRYFFRIPILELDCQS